MIIFIIFYQKIDSLPKIDINTFPIVEKILERDIPGWQETDNIVPQQIEAQTA